MNDISKTGRELVAAFDDANDDYIAHGGTVERYNSTYDALLDYIANLESRGEQVPMDWRQDVPGPALLVEVRWFKCPACGELTFGPVRFCPHCGVRFAEVEE